jgi:hypothetical protein
MSTPRPALVPAPRRLSRCPTHRLIAMNPPRSMSVHTYAAALAADARAGGDLLEQLDAGEECRHGRLPFDPTPECGCWRAATVESSPEPVVAPELGAPLPEPVSHRVGLGRRLTDEQIAAAHLEHLDGVSIGELGRRLWRKGGYRSAENCTIALRRAFAHHGLATTDRSAAEYLQRRAKAPRCSARRSDGRPCEYKALEGQDVCGHHTPEEMERTRRSLARFRERLHEPAAERDHERAAA